MKKSLITCNQFQKIKRSFHIYTNSTLLSNLPNIQFDDFFYYSGSSNIIFINYVDLSPDIILFLFFFDDKVWIIDQKSTSQIYQLFKNNTTMLQFLNDQVKNKFDFYLEDSIIKKIEFEAFKKNELNQKEKLIKSKIWDSLIQIAYINSQIKNNHFNSVSFEINNYKYIDFVEIQSLCSNVKLYYNTNDKLLYAIKNFSDSTLFSREMQFYQTVANKNQFICKCYGQIYDKKLSSIVLQFIDGPTLKNFIEKNNSNITLLDKIKIILEIIISVEYIHYFGFVLRDLKSDNIMIDSKMNSILIDFNYAIHYLSDEYDDVGSPLFVSPEQYCNNEFSFKSDMYSIAMIIIFILSGQTIKSLFNFNCYEDPERHKEFIQKILLLLPKECDFLKCAYEKCLDYDPKNRPSITELLQNLLKCIEAKFGDLQVFKDLYETRNKQISSLFDLSFIKESNAFPNHFIFHDFNKSFKVLKLASDHNNSLAQYYLGEIYYQNKFIQRDIAKSIHFLILSAKQNNPDAQYDLGVIYYENKDVKRDINKSIDFLDCSAKQKNVHALNLLGKIYYEGNDVPQDIEKAINYSTHASELNSPESQYRLGLIYFEKEMYDEMMHYLNLASNSNHMNAQIMLSSLYYDGEYVEQDINKSISLLQKNAPFSSLAKNNLGVIYKKGILNGKSIDESVTLFKDATSKDNDNYSSYNLAKIHYFGEYGESDAKKSIELLEKTASNNFFPAYVFLFYIFCCGKEEELRNNEKALHYLNKIECIDEIIYVVLLSIINNEKSPLRSILNNFFVKYDLMYSIDNSFASDFINFMNTEE